MTKTSINHLKSILKKSSISTFLNADNVEVTEAGALNWVAEFDFKNPLLNSYRDDLLRRGEELQKSIGANKLKELQEAKTNFVKENQELCATWASIILEVVGLYKIGFSGLLLDDLGLTDRLITNEPDDDGVYFG